MICLVKQKWILRLRFSQCWIRIFWDVTPFSLVKVYGCSGERLHLQTWRHCFLLASCWTYSLTLKVAAIHSPARLYNITFQKSRLKVIVVMGFGTLQQHGYSWLSTLKKYCLYTTVYILYWTFGLNLGTKVPQSLLNPVFVPWNTKVWYRKIMDFPWELPAQQLYGFKI